MEQISENSGQERAVDQIDAHKDDLSVENRTDAVSTPKESKPRRRHSQLSYRKLESILLRIAVLLRRNGLGATFGYLRSRREREAFEIYKIYSQLIISELIEQQIIGRFERGDALSLLMRNDSAFSRRMTRIAYIVLPELWDIVKKKLIRQPQPKGSSESEQAVDNTNATVIDSLI